MQNETVSPNGVHITGDFQGWNPATSMMTDVDMDGVYEFTAMVDENTTVEYKFINGNDWPQQESVPNTCGVDDNNGGFNRSLAIGTVDMSADTVCFSSCTNCGVITPDSTDVTFRVSMVQQIVGVDGVYLHAYINGNEIVELPMSDNNGDGVYEYTMTLPSVQQIFYLYMNGSDLASAETVPEECGVLNGDPFYLRTADISLVDTTFDIVCFNECANCFTGETNMITFKVNMQDQTVSPNGVHIAGNFQGWDPAATLMTDDNADNIFEITVETDEWANLSFKFINGNDWASSETVPSACGLPDGNGGYNRILETGSVDFVFGPVCFNECEDCAVVGQMIAVTFMVNMSNQTVSPNGVHIAGDFQNWNPATSIMTDLDADGTYEFTADIAINSSPAFKFINGNAWGAGEEVVPSACGVSNGFGGFNRSIDVLEVDTTYGPVCFSSCENCMPVMPVLITFRVDMSNQIVGAEGVYIAGDFNNWDPTATQMSEYEADHYQAVVVMNSGEHTGYKFLNGPAWTGSETVPSVCGEDDGNGGFNRGFTATATTEIVPLVCFSECSSCTIVNMVDVTFQVDMSTQTVSANGVHLAGSFNAFSPTATVMSDIGSAVYTVTVTIPENTGITYKFINGNDFTGVETVPFACGVDDGFGGFNRSFTTSSGDVVLPEVCFSACVDCPINVDEINGVGFSIYPNPAYEYFNISSMSATHFVSVYDATGKLVLSEKLNTGINTIQTSQMKSGLYQVVIPGIGKQSLIVR